MMGGEADHVTELGRAVEEVTMSFAEAVQTIGEQMVTAGWVAPPPPRRHGWYPHRPVRRPAASRVRQVGQRQ